MSGERLWSMGLPITAQSCVAADWVGDTEVELDFVMVIICENLRGCWRSTIAFCQALARPRGLLGLCCFLGLGAQPPLLEVPGAGNGEYISFLGHVGANRGKWCGLLSDSLGSQVE